MGKTKARAQRVSGARRRTGREGTAETAPASLPSVSELHDIPAFGDLRTDADQRAAFAAFVAQRADCDAISASEMRLGFVVRLDRGFPLVATEDATVRAEHAVAFTKSKAGGDRLLPAIGDAVAVRMAPGHEKAVIECVLPRRTAFERWRGRNRGERQVLAANVDVIFIVQPLGSERNAAQPMRDRIARSMVLARDCGAEPVVVLTKTDRCAPEVVDGHVADVRLLVGEGVRVLATSARRGTGLEEVRSCVPAGVSAMILGESGAGKSTLLNALLGHEALATGEVRARDDAGRHTTVARIMVALPDPCGVIADCPGLRSLPLVGHERGLARAFPEVVEASRACRFNDCTHSHEPGCAVRDGVANGAIESVRAEAFLSLAIEMRVSAQSLDPDIRI